MTKKSRNRRVSIRSKANPFGFKGSITSNTIFGILTDDSKFIKVLNSQIKKHGDDSRK